MSRVQPKQGLTRRPRLVPGPALLPPVHPAKFTPMTAVVIQNPNRLGYIKRDKKRYTLLRERRRYPALWAKAGAVPSLDLRFADNKSLVDAVTGQSLVTFTRASSGTFVDSAGLITTATTNEPRFDHNPTTGESLGLWVEEARTNLVLNSGTLLTQSVTVTAVAHTLHFTGTGTITLTGVSTAGPLVGTGTGESNRVSLTFTPTAGSLTLTVSGTVTNAQLEAGAFRTSYIPTTTATATRAADVASITGSAFSSWYRQDEGTIYVQGSTSASASNPILLSIEDGTVNERIQIRRIVASNLAHGSVADGGVSQGAPSVTGFNANTIGKICMTYALNNLQLSFNGALGIADTSATIPTVDRAFIGSASSPLYANGHISRLTFWPQALLSRLQSITQ